MSLYGSAAEYGLHCLLHLAGPPDGGAPSSADMAAFQGISPSYVAKLFTQLEKAGIVDSAEGIGGGYRLARPPEEITVLEVVDAVEGGKSLFKCREIRRNCILYGDAPPPSATRGLCGIHALMREAEQRMRSVLGERTLADLAASVRTKIPATYRQARNDWFDERRASRPRAARRSVNNGGTDT